METAFWIEKWTLERENPQSNTVTFNKGIDTFEFVKEKEDEKSFEYYVNARKSTPLFRLDMVWRFKFEKGTEKHTRGEMEDRMKEIISVEGGSLLSVFLKYFGVAPFQVL